MSPALSKTTDAEIIAAARRLIDQRGCDAITLRDIAETVGVKAPSLYKRFDDRVALLKAVRKDAFSELQREIEAAADLPDPSGACLRMAAAYRAFASRQPQLYKLMHRPELMDEAPDAERRAAGPALKAMEALVGRSHALEAARCLTSFLHGFVSMEIEGSFRLGGSVEEAFAFSLEAILAGLLLKAPEDRQRAPGEGL